MLADRLSARFHREVCYSTLPFDTRVHAAAFDRASGLNLVIGAVDNAAARRAIAETLGGADSRNPWDHEPPAVVWLDAGNGHNSGQVLGNALRPDELRRSFDRDFGFCYALPAPSLQRPDLLHAPPAPRAVPDPTCAEAVDQGDQSRTINQKAGEFRPGKDDGRPPPRRVPRSHEIGDEPTIAQPVGRN